MRILPLLLISIVILSCTEEDISTSQLAISTSTEHLTLKNNSDSTIYYFIIDQNSLNRIDWAPTVGKETPQIKPISKTEILITDFKNEQIQTNKYVVSYWNAMLIDNAPSAGEVKTQIVTIN